MPGNPTGSKTVDEILIVHIQLLGLINYFYNYKRFRVVSLLRMQGRLGICQTDKIKAFQTEDPAHKTRGVVK